jgi:hypothetical protein
MRKYLTALAVTAAATLLASGSAGAVTAAAALAAPAPLAGPLHVGPPGGPGSSEHHFHHHAPNCNNDPDSEFAMDPDVCPPSNNADAYDDEDEYPGYH